MRTAVLQNVNGDRTLTVKQLESGGEGRWDAFVEQCQEATFCHRADWKQVLEQAFGHPTHFLYAESEGQIEGVLPLGRVKSWLFGDALISAPFCVYGGVAAESETARDALETEACRLADELGVDHLELRNREPRHPEWPNKDLYVTFRKEIDPEPDNNLRAIPRKQRAMVRKGIQAGLQSIVDDDIDRFYKLYSESMRNLGTPIFPKRYFQVLKEVFGDACEILTVFHQDQPLSSVMSFYFRDEVLPYYGGGTGEARQYYANDFMYWELMRWSCERGLRIFDYGRSKRDTGSYRFKKHWGFEPEPLHYEYHLVQAKEMPDLNPLNPKYRLFIRAWQHLPVRLTQMIGPPLARNLG